MTPAFPDTELIERLRMAALVDSAIGRYYDHDLLMATVARMTTLEKNLEQAHNALRQAHPDLAMWNMDTSYIDDALAGVDVPGIVQCPNCFLMIDPSQSIQQATAPTVHTELKPEYSYALHAHAERWSGPFNSIVEAITEGLGEYVPDQDKVVYVGENEPVEINADSLAEEVIERIQEQAEEQVGEVADSIGPFTEAERKPLADAIEAWVNEHADITCWSVCKIKAYRPGDAEYEAARAMTPLIKENGNV